MKSCLVNGSFFLLLLFWCSNCPTFYHWKFSQWPFDISSLFPEHFFTFWHSKASQTSSCTLPNLECAISLRNLVSFNGEWYFKTLSWAFRCVYCFWTVIAPRPSQWVVDRAMGFVIVHTHTWKHTYICSYVLYQQYILTPMGLVPSQEWRIFSAHLTPWRTSLLRKRKVSRITFSMFEYKLTRCYRLFPPPQFPPTSWCVSFLFAD